MIDSFCQALQHFPTFIILLYTTTNVNMQKNNHPLRSGFGATGENRTRDPPPYQGQDL